jgi:hypothetical protein
MRFISQLENAFIEKKRLCFAMCAISLTSGIKQTEVLRAIWKENEQEIATNTRVISVSYLKKTTGFHYCAIEILTKELHKNYKRKMLIEKLITTNSWWDTVDSISKYWSISDRITRMHCSNF